jgi:biopolymer transport protein ExbB
MAPAHPRRSTFLLACLAALVITTPVGVLGVLAPTAHAQEGDEGKEPPAKSSGGETKRGHSFKEIFIHIVRSVGPFFGIILLLVSIALLSIVVLLSMELRLSSAIPPVFVEDFTDTVNKRRFKEAYDMAKDDGSYLGRVLTTGMSRLQYGLDDAREAAFNMAESIKAGKEQLVVYLATIGTLGPLLGLVGTVWGMILAFMELASTQSGVNAQRLADAISHALVVTLLGIGLSVPAIFCHAFFKNRLIRVAHDTSNVADDLLTQMYHNSKKPGTPSSPAVDVAAPAVPPPPPVDRGIPSPAIKQK